MSELRSQPVHLKQALWFWLFLLLLSGTTPADAQQPYRLRIGDKVADIELTRLGGGNLRLSQVQRQALAVTFFSPYCEPCRRELPILARVVARVGHDTGGNIWMVVILADDPPDAGIVKKLGSQVIWLWDENQKAKSALDPRTLPSTFIFGSDGIVRRINRGIGPQYEARVERWLRRLILKKNR